MSDRKRRKRDETTAIATSPDTTTRSITSNVLDAVEDDAPDADWTPKRRTRSSRVLETATSTLEPLKPSLKLESAPISPRKRGPVKQRAQESPTHLLAGATDPGERYGDLNQDSYFAETFHSLATGEPIIIIGVFDGTWRPFLLSFHATLCSHSTGTSHSRPSFPILICKIIFFV